jgi:hypothetical protein
MAITTLSGNLYYFIIILLFIYLFVVVMNVFR